MVFSDVSKDVFYSFSFLKEVKYFQVVVYVFSSEYLKRIVEDSDSIL